MGATVMSMSTTGYEKCAFAAFYSLPGNVENCYVQNEFKLPDGRTIKIVIDGIVYIDDEAIDLPYRGSFLYSRKIERPLVKMLYMYAVKGVIAPELGFAFFHVDSPVGPFTVAMMPDGTYVGVDAMITFGKIRGSFPLDKMYIIQFIIEVEKKYFNRNEFEKYVRWS